MNPTVWLLACALVPIELSSLIQAGVSPPVEVMEEFDGEPDATEAVEDKDEIRWLDSLAEGYIASQQNNRPIFVRAVTTWCPHCRRLTAEMETPVVQQALSRWTLVEIDVDKSPQDAVHLAIGPVPALRLLSPRGKLLQSHEGSLDADPLMKWLSEHYPDLAVNPIAELTADGTLTPDGVGRLVRELEDRDALLREAAIRRFIPHRNTAATDVVRALANGTLSTRLAAIDVLAEWKAPVEDLDPWRPETISETRVRKLEEWASDPEPMADRRVEELDAASIRATIQAMISAPQSEAEAIRERLARFRQALVPLVNAELDAADTDVALRRLRALRYRLFASDQLVLGWPGCVDRLASSDTRGRELAAEELANRATSDDVGLLLELFRDPAPLVREISLQALAKLDGTEAHGSLVQLLDDPDPNVRAAVLKQLAELPLASPATSPFDHYGAQLSEESPSQSIVPAVVQYALNEPDADLVVHAVRVLSQTQGEEAVRGLMQLLKHDSWQVRAEAADGLAKALHAPHQIPNELPEDIRRALESLLEDPDDFVASRASVALRTPKVGVGEPYAYDWDSLSRDEFSRFGDTPGWPDTLRGAVGGLLMIAFFLTVLIVVRRENRQNCAGTRGPGKGRQQVYRAGTARSRSDD